MKSVFEFIFVTANREPFKDLGHEYHQGLTWQGAELEGPGEVEEGVTRGEDVGALWAGPEPGHVGALPVRAKLGAVLQRQPVVAVIQHQDRRPEKHSWLL